MAVNKYINYLNQPKTIYSVKIGNSKVFGKPGSSVEKVEVVEEPVEEEQTMVENHKEEIVELWRPDPADLEPIEEEVTTDEEPQTVEVNITTPPTAEEESLPQETVEEPVVEEETPAPKKRGRKKKAETEATEAEEERPVIKVEISE